MADDEEEWGDGPAKPAQVPSLPKQQITSPPQPVLSPPVMSPPRPVQNGLSPIQPRQPGIREVLSSHISNVPTQVLTNRMSTITINQSPPRIQESPVKPKSSPLSNSQKHASPAKKQSPPDSFQGVKYPLASMNGGVQSPSRLHAATQAQSRLPAAMLMARQAEEVEMPPLQPLGDDSDDEMPPLELIGTGEEEEEEEVEDYYPGNYKGSYHYPEEDFVLLYVSNFSFQISPVSVVFYNKKNWSLLYKIWIACI